MATNDSEIVELIIDAKNLTSDELNQAATDVEGLGAAARKTSDDLAKLKVKQDVIKSYEQVGDSVRGLRKELAQAEVDYENLAAATKKNKEATDDERTSVKLAKKDLDDLKNTLKEQEREYRKLSSSVKAYGVTTSNTKEKQEELSAQIRSAKGEVSRLTDEYQKQAKSLKTKVTAEKESLEVSDAHAEALKEQVHRQEQATELAVKQARQEKLLATETKRVTDAVTKYEKELSKLNAERNGGKLSQAQYIRGEAALRKELKLTEGQVKTSRAAIQADSVTKKNAAKNTDLLTTATRRLAQIYTTLLAAQKAVQAVGSGVKEYGELEAAITKVEKTTGLARDEVIAMTDELKLLSEDVTPTATNEMLRFAEVAGQLGTKSTEDILNLVSASDALERSTNLAGDEAAELLARILQMTGEGIPSIHNLSSSVVALGNDFAVSEQDIVHMTKEIISGTREINLGSAAAAAFGTTLKELGQPAERSRTAIQRLGGAIKKATIEGGDDLERLSEITGIAADELEKNLGERPEKVLLAFLEGLSRIDDAGGQVSTVLRKMGIDGTEATGVLSVLAGGTDRLTQALKLSNEQFEAGDAHIKEAVKSYADQESALGRLANKFTTLTSKIGEAFSDETDRAVRGLGDAIKSTEGDVVSLMEYLPELVEGFVELGDAVTGIVESFTGDDGIGAITAVAETIKFSFNGVTLLINQITLNIQEATLAIAQMQNQLTIFDSMKLSDEFIKNLESSITSSKDKINQDLVDISTATKRLNGESSIAFEGLIATSGKYSEAISNLSDKQQAQIQTIISKNQYVAEEDGLYRRLTAAIIRANREMEIEVELKNKSAAAAAKKAKADSDSAAATEQQDAINKKANISLGEYNKILDKVKDAQLQVNEARDRGIITDESADNVIQRLTETLNEYNIVASEGNVIVNKQVDSTNEYMLKRSELDEQNKAGLLTDRELVIAQQDLAASFSSSVTSINGSILASQNLTREQAVLNDKIGKSKQLISDLRTEQAAGNLSTGEAIRLANSLAVEEAKLNELKEDKLNLDRLQNATYPQLITMQREYQTQLDITNRQFRAGTLSKAEYEKRTREITAALNELNGVLGVNTDELEDNNDEIERRLGLLGDQQEEEEEVTRFMSLELAVAQMLGKAYDFTGQSVSELNARYKELQASIIRNDAVTVGWMANLAKVSNEVFQQEQAVIQDTIAMRRWITEIESGALSMEELGKRAAYADRYFDSLSDNQMKPLLSAISKAQSEFAKLTGTIDSTVADIQDRLDLALGNTSEIAKRKFEQEIAELQALIDEAEAYGNNSLVRQLESALSDLKRAQKLEYESEFGKNAQQQSQPTTPQPSGTQQTTQQPSGAQPGGVTTLRLMVGDSGFNTQISRDTLEQLMAEITRRQKIGG